MERYWELRGRGSVADLFEACLTFYLEEKDPVRRERTKKGERSSGKAKVSRPASEKQTSMISPTLPVKKRRVEDRSVEDTTRRYISTKVKRAVRERSLGECEFVDPQTHRRCESKYLLQFDHIKAFALGGTSEFENIRHLCAVHNQYLGDQVKHAARARRYAYSSIAGSFWTP